MFRGTFRGLLRFRALWCAVRLLGIGLGLMFIATPAWGRGSASVGVADDHNAVALPEEGQGGGGIAGTGDAAATSIAAAHLDLGDIDQDGRADHVVLLPFEGDWARGQIGQVVIVRGGAGILHTIAPRGPELFALGARLIADLDGDEVPDLAVRSLLPPAPGETECRVAWRAVSVARGVIIGGGLLTDEEAVRHAWACADEVEEAVSLSHRPGDVDGNGVVDERDVVAATRLSDPLSVIHEVVRHLGEETVLRVGWARGATGAIVPAWSGPTAPAAASRGWDIDCSPDCFFDPHRPGGSPHRPGGSGVPADPFHDPPDRPGVTITPPPPPDTSWCLADLDGDGVAEADEDDDCDGILNRDDCDSACFSGTPGCCLDLDGNGLIGQQDPGSGCYRPTPGEVWADVNGDGVVDEADAAAMNEQSADAGVIILVNSLDHDRDGFPDLADGLNLIDHPAVLVDDSVPWSGMTPLRIDLAAAAPDDIITITYDASDPGVIDPVTLTPAPGHLRLWRLFEQGRDPRPVDQGGDWIAPGTYAAGDLTAEGALFLLAEAIRPSEAPGDLEIEVIVETAPPGGGPPCVHEQGLRLTAVEVVLEARLAGDEYWQPWPVLVLSHGTPEGEEELPPSLLEGPWAEHRIRVRDPRGPDAVDVFELGRHELPLTRRDGDYVTPPFVCIGPDAADEEFGAHRVLQMDRGAIAFSYNPAGVLHTNVDLSTAPRYQRELVELVEELTTQMKAEDWPPAHLRTGPAARDSGLFGKEVHRRVAERLEGDERWLVNALIDRDTRQIVGFGVRGTKQLVQVDLIRLKAGYTPQVGEVLDASRINDAIDVKAGLSGDIDEDQLNRIRLVTDKDVSIARSLNRYTPRRGWHINESVVRRGRLARAFGAARNVASGKGAKAIGAVGTVVAIQSLLGNSRYDRELDEVARAMDAAARETDPYQKPVDMLLAMDMLTNYLGHFSPDPDSIKVIGYVTFLKIWGSTE